MAVRDFIGTRGESIVVARLTDFCGSQNPYFAPHYLGEKCPTFDYLVELVTPGESPPYFFVQVKATKEGYTKRTAQLKVKVRKTDLENMAECPVPTYLIGVDEPGERAFIVSIHGKVVGPISSIPTAYPLSCENLRRLWDEVRDYWKTLDFSVKTSVFTLQDQDNGK